MEIGAQNRLFQLLINCVKYLVENNKIKVKSTQKETDPVRVTARSDVEQHI